MLAKNGFLFQNLTDADSASLFLFFCKFLCSINEKLS